MIRSSRHVRAARGLTAALVALFLLGVPPLRAVRTAAHAIVLESVPARDATLDRAPEQVVLRFNSKIEKRLSRVTLAAGRGTAVSMPISTEGQDEPDRLIVPLRPLPPGAYVVRYKVLSVDGHITEGALRFTVTGSRP